MPLFLFFFFIIFGSCLWSSESVIDEQIRRLTSYRIYLIEKFKSPIQLDKIPCEKIDIKEGECFPFLPQLRNQLIFRGIITAPKTADEFLFDSNLVDAIKRIQKNHFQEESGILDEKTCKLINRDISHDLSLIDTNLKRLNRIKEKLFQKKKAVFVNVAHYQLFALRKNKVDFSMKIIVGSPSRPTPISDDLIDAIVLSPSWTIPKNILVKDKIKVFSKKPDALEKQGIRVFDTDGDELEPHEINWNDVKNNPHSYRFQQAPGAKNALGGIKFILANKNDIRMHGTNQVNLFKKNRRSLSSGCIRLEHPETVAQWLLTDHKDKVCTFDKKENDCVKQFIKSKSNKKASHHFKLPESVPIIFDYITLWIDENGTVFRNDPYSIDIKKITLF